MVTKMTEPSHRVPPDRKVTFEEFLAWCDEDVRAEWVNGEVIVDSPASFGHQTIGSFLEAVLSIYVETHKLGVVLRAPFLMRLSEVSSAREPDILFVAQDRLHLVGKTFLDGPADLVVEIVSPESIGRDRGEKFVEYERAGVKEYWLIDPERQRPEFYELASDGRYRLALTDKEGVYHSKIIPGFWLCIDWLWQTPPPPVLEVLREMKII